MFAGRGADKAISGGRGGSQAWRMAAGESTAGENKRVFFGFFFLILGRNTTCFNIKIVCYEYQKSGK